MSGLSWALIAIFVGSGIYLSGWGREPPRPIIQDGWFGRGDKKADDKTIRPYKIAVPEEVLTDLKLRLNNSRFGEDLENNENFYYGMNVATMKVFASHWKEKYDWRKYESELNQFPQFVTQIEGIDVHFIRVKPPTKRKSKYWYTFHIPLYPYLHVHVICYIYQKKFPFVKANKQDVLQDILIRNFSRHFQDIFMQIIS